MLSSSPSFHTIPDFFSPFPPPDPCRPPLQSRQEHCYRPPYASEWSHRRPPLPAYFLVAAGHMLLSATFPDHGHPPPPGPCPHHRCFVLLPGSVGAPSPLGFLISTTNNSAAAGQCPFLQPPLVVTIRSSRSPLLAKPFPSASHSQPRHCPSQGCFEPPL